MPPHRSDIRAWRPAVEGITEVFHAHFVDHVYPTHTHTAWTLLIIDDGGIRYDLDRHHHASARSTVTILPPHVAHDGRSATPGGFRKRVLYLDSAVLDDDLIGAAVDRPNVNDALLRHRIHQLHLSLGHPGDTFVAESRLALVRERLREHLRPAADTAANLDGSAVPGSRTPPSRSVANRFRELLDANVAGGLSLREAALELHAHPAHLVRAFSSAFGMPPHGYLTGRRIDIARRLLLDGQRPADVAPAVGFYDQAHMTRHFVRYLGTSPGRYQGTRP